MKTSARPLFRLRNCRAFLLAATLLGAGLQAAPVLPSGGSVVAGAGSVSAAGSTLTVTQNTAKLAVNWDSFSIGEGAAVRFVQPSASSVALNRVTGGDASVIQGSLTSNGQVFLLNPSGVLFSKTANVTVGGLVASTLSLSNEDFLAGNYAFGAPGSGLVVNEGSLVAVDGGSISLIAAKVVNDGSITAERGSVNLAAGSRVTLSLGGLVNLTVDQGAIDALVSNGGAIRADGGQVLLTARGAGELAPAAISNAGIIEARTLATGEQGDIRLLGGLTGGDAVSVSGSLDASAPNGGNGGFIETSAAHVDIAETASINASAVAGKTGTWLLDPDFLEIVLSGGELTVAAANAASDTSKISVTTLSAALANATVSLEAVKQIDFQVSFNYTGATDAVLNLLAPTIKLGGDITTSGRKLAINFGDGTVPHAGNVFLYNPDGATIINRKVETKGGDIRFYGNIGGAHNFLADAGEGDVRFSSTVSGDFLVWQLRTGTMAFSYQAGGGQGATTTIDFITPTATNEEKVFFDDNGTITRANQIKEVVQGQTTYPILIPTGYLVLPAGTAIDFNAGNVFVKITYPDGTNDGGNKLKGAPNGFVTFPTATSVAKITFEQTNGSWTDIVAAGVTWMSESVAGKPLDLTVKAKTTTIDAGKTLSVNGNIEISTAKFVNNSGSTALAAGTGKTWQVWSSNPTPFGPADADVDGDLPYDFKQYGATYGVTTPGQATGNGMFYTYQPNLSATLTSTVTKVYNGNTNAINLTNANYALPGNAVDGDVVTFTGTLPSTGTYASKNVGASISITSSPIPVENISAVSSTGKPVYGYGPSSLTATGNIGIITKKELTSITGITAQSRDYDKTTDATLNTGSASFGGLVTNDSLSITSATGTFSDKDSANGKTVNVTNIVLGGDDAGNYSLPGSVTTTASIFKLNITGITGITAQNKVYDGNTTATLNTGSAGFTGLLEGETLSVGSSTGNFVDKNVGDGKTVNITGLTISGLDAINYNLTATTATTTANITKKQLSSLTGITANDRDYDKTTDATLNTGSASFGGLVTNDVLTIATATGTFEDKNSADGKNVSITGITLGGADAGNYELPEGPFSTTASIFKLNITGITGITAQNKVYDGNTTATLNTGSAGFTGLLSGETLTVGSATGNFVDKNVGDGKTVNITGLTITGLDAINYNLTATTATTTANITKLKLSSLTGITAQDRNYDKTTDATLNTGSVSFGGLVTNDVLTIAAATGTFEDKNSADGKNVSITGITLGGADAGNYELPEGPFSATASIFKLNITGITGITAQNKVYDGNTTATLNTGSAGFTGLLSGETLTVGSATGAFVDKNVGDGKTVNITGLTITGLDAINYVLTATTATTTANITKLQLTSLTGITAQDRNYDKTTDATLNTGSASFGGLLTNDVLTIAAATGTFEDKNSADGKTVNITGITFGGADAGNYSLPEGPFTTTASIFKLNITGITGITAQNKVYDGNTTATLNTGSAGFTGLLSGETLTVGSSTGDFVDKNVGDGKTVNITGLTISGLDAINYNLTATTATTAANITKKKLSSLTGLSAQNKTYDGGTSATLNTASPTFGGLVTDDVLTITAATGNFVDKNAADGKTVNITGIVLGGTDAGNYELPDSVTTTADIGKAALSVTANSLKLDYTGTPYAGGNGIEFSGFVGQEGSADLQGSLTYGGSSQGAVRSGDYDITPAGLTSGNYEITFVNGILTIDVAPPVVDPRDFLPRVLTVPVYPVATAAVQLPISVGGLNYVPATPAGVPIAPAPAAAAETGETVVGKATDRIDKGASRAIQGPTDVLVINGGVNLGIRPISAE